MIRSRHSQRGITLVEALVSIGILATITTGIVALTNQASEDTRASVTALHLKTVGDAANAYIKDNYAAVTAVATDTVPALIRVSDLVSAGYLNSGFSLKNARQQDTCVLVLEPTANNLTGMVVTEGGDTLDDLTLGQVAATVGAAGGGIYSTATTTFQGAMGGWSSPFGNFANANNLGQKCNGDGGAITLAAGHPVMALWFADGTSVSATLYRDAVPGNPSLNTMNTPIIMGAGAIQTPGNACAADGALGRDADGGVVSCVSGTWKLAGGSAYWGDPVDQAAAMPACTATNANETRVRFGYATAPTRRIFTCDGTSWVAVGVDHAGNLTVPGNLSVTGTTTLTGAMTANGTVATNGAVTANSGVTIGDGTAANATNTLVLNRTATEGAACSPNGAVARDANGLLLSCQSGVWKKATGSGGTGLSGLLAPLKGKTISCRDGSFYGYAYVDANGNPFTRATRNFGWASYDSGWVSGFYARTIINGADPYDIASWGFGAYPHLVGSNNANCTANWPLT